MRELNYKILKSYSDLSKTLTKKGFTDKKIVFTNGCFDILHYGHIKLLIESKKQGDLLIVGLNSDNSIKKIKGPDRPINNNHQRSLMLASLSYVDFVVFFSDPSPIKLIKKIKPSVITKGGDYNLNSIIGANYIKSIGGEVKIIPLVPNLSTSKLSKNYKF
tara:strand:- start:33389 stop:33871 length:483 start_codon:yes stop_codon:yes gene_type:complete